MLLSSSVLTLLFLLIKGGHRINFNGMDKNLDKKDKDKKKKKKTNDTQETLLSD